MEKVISCCGINCAGCDARIATLTDDNELRAKTTYSGDMHPVIPVICTQFGG